MATEPKTKPTDASVADFLAAVDNPRRRADAQVVADLFAEVTGDRPVMWGPSIVGYGVYEGATGDWPVIGFSPRKANLVLYLMGGFDGCDALVARLGKVKTSVACIYVNKLDDIDLDVLRELTVASLADMRARYKTRSL